MVKIVLITGGFDPIHSGHIEYINEARKLGDYLFVGLNSDEWLTRKKGKPFMPWSERHMILSNIKNVYDVFAFDDHDNSAIDAIRTIRESNPATTIVFANGGDRTNENIPEMACGIDNVEFIFGVGGQDKKNSSSWILNSWDKISKERPWGRWSVLKNYPNVKVKELTVLPGQSLSMQRHTDRSEFWFVAEGIATVSTLNVSSDEDYETVEQFSHVWIRKHQWHRLSNQHNTVLKLVEVQWGDRCDEDDIERI
jgi:cytidyltransferase-like protein